MNASSFISLGTCMLRQNGKRSYKGLYITFKLAPDLKKNTVYLSSYSPLNEGDVIILTNPMLRTYTSDDLKNLSTLQTFKKRITSSFNNSCVPSHFTIGNRYIFILHARLRNNCSNLNNDLFRNHLRDNPLCDLCGMIEDAIHYFFHCRKFTMEQQVFNDTVRVFQPLSIDMILCGNFNLNMENNIVLFRAVHRYIHATKRFKTSWLFAWSFLWNIFCILISILMTNLFYSQVEGVPGSRTIIYFLFCFLFFF